MKQVSMVLFVGHIQFPTHSLHIIKYIFYVMNQDFVIDNKTAKGFHMM